MPLWRRVGCVLSGLMFLAGGVGVHIQADRVRAGNIQGEYSPKQMELLALSGVAIGAAGLYVGFHGEPGKAAAQLGNRAVDLLDQAVIWFTKSDALTIRGLLNGGVAIFGRSGAGKSSGSGLHLAKGLVEYGGSGGLILASKPEDKEFWQKLFKRAGRKDDLLVFEPSSPFRFNLVNFEMEHGADSREITQGILTVGEVYKRGEGGRASNEAFFEGQKERNIHNGVEAIRKAFGFVTIPMLQRFIVDGATSPAQLKDAEWRKGFHYQTMARAYCAQKTPIEQYDFEQVKDYWVNEWPAMDAKLRGSILADVMGVLHVFNTGTVRELLSTKTNVTPAVTEKGKWVLVNTPVHSHGAGGRFILASWKWSVQRYILRRQAHGDSGPIIIWSDEYQNVANSFDSTFLAECRSHRGAMVVLTQSLHSFEAMPGKSGEHQVQALLTNFGTKVFNALGDDQTAAYATSLIGKSLQSFSGGSLPPQDNLFEAMLGVSKFSSSFNEHYENVLQNNAFFSLRTGGPGNGFLCDAIVIRSGEPFSNGQNWLKVAFSQKG